MWSTLRYLRDVGAAAGCLENVLGIKLSCGNEKAPISVLEAELLSMGYESMSIEVDLQSFKTTVGPGVPESNQSPATSCNGEAGELLFSKFGTCLPLSLFCLSQRSSMRIFIMFCKTDLDGKAVLHRAKQMLDHVFDTIAKERSPVPSSSLLLPDDSPELEEALHSVSVCCCKLEMLLLRGVLTPERCQQQHELCRPLSLES